MGEYLILGMLVALLMRKLNIRKTVAVASFICLLYAISDELHQIFVPGRGPAITDVLLDFVSSIIGISLISLFFFRKKWQN